RFNSRDFDAVRDMLAEDVRLEVVARACAAARYTIISPIMRRSTIGASSPAKSRGGRRFWPTTQVSRGRGRPISSCWSGRAAKWSASAISGMRVTRLRARKWSTCLQAQPDKRSLSMRRFVESGLVSLDGVFGHPHICANENLGREVIAYALKLLSGADAML